VGDFDGATEGLYVVVAGHFVGGTLGCIVGISDDGCAVGTFVGIEESGRGDGDVVGTSLDGYLVGCGCVGVPDGETVGVSDGKTDGNGVG
jgi:hypothetical protein